MKSAKIPKLSPTQEAFFAANIDIIFSYMDANQLNDDFYDNLLCCVRKTVQDCTKRNGSIDFVDFYFASLESMDAAVQQRTRISSSQCEEKNMPLSNVLRDPLDYAESIEHALDIHTVAEQILGMFTGKTRKILNMLANQYDIAQIAKAVGYSRNQVDIEISRIRRRVYQIYPPAQIRELL